MEYDPAIFADVKSEDDAKSVILGPDGVFSTDERWEIETKYLIDLIRAHMPIDDALCLDYGCGIGRLSKELLNCTNWAVVGYDISKAMKEMAERYVDEPLRFGIGNLLYTTNRFDYALAVWVLQHCPYPENDIAKIRDNLRPGGRLFVLNLRERCVPCRGGWYDDGYDVWDKLSHEFATVHIEQADPAIIPRPSWWGVFTKGG